MQDIVMYVNAANTLGAVRDYANAKSASAPVFTRGVGVSLRMRLFSSDGEQTAYPIEKLASVSAWKFVMDDDYDENSESIIAADNELISVSSVTELINDTEYTFTEVAIPIAEMNTQELADRIGVTESISINAELVGYDSEGAECFVLQVKGFTIRNRISSTGDPSDLPSEYLNETQVRALLTSGLEFIFSETASENAADWHTVQTGTDLFVRMRLNGDNRDWISGNASDYGWSACFGLLKGADGEAGIDGLNCFVAFATDSSGSNFTTNGSEWTLQHRYIGFVTTQNTSVTAEDFSGKWIQFIPEYNAENFNIQDTAGYFDGTTVEAALQEIGYTFEQINIQLAEI